MTPEKLDDCAESVLADNPDMDESRAYAICQAMENRGELEDNDPTELLGDGTCPEGMVDINGACVDVEEVDLPNYQMSSPRVLSQRKLAGKIERIEQEDGSVRYTDICLLQEGIWTDQSSKQPTHYDPKNLEISKDNAVNIAHDDDNEVSEVGEIDAESAYVEDGGLYADIVLHCENAASEYADENMQKTLETGGDKGFGGPSVEIPADGLEIDPKGERGYPKVAEGVVDGLGLVKSPASKPTAFDTQTRERAVALASGQTDKALYLEQKVMSPETQSEIRAEILSRELQVDEIQDDAENIADELDIPVGDVMEVLDPLLDMGEENEGDGGDETEDPDDEGAEAGDGGDEEEEEDTEMAEDVDDLREQIDDLWQTIEELKSEMATGEEMSEELSEAKEELAEAESVQELQEANEELEKRLSEVEEQEIPSRTLAEGNEDTEETEYSPISPSQSRGY